VFYDFTCSAPKSVSVLAVTLDDQRLAEAHEEAARLAFRELETFAATRVRKQGGQKDRTTGNLVAAAFVHDSSRALDPQLHTHFTVFNATFDAQEQCWKALQARGMYDAIRYGTAVYRNELVRRVQQIGYSVVPAKHGFEIQRVSDDVLKRFSKRAQQRDAVVKEMEERLGRKLSNNEISHAVHQSRAKKVKGISTADVRQRQLAQLSADERQSLERLRADAHSSCLLAHVIEHPATDAPIDDAVTCVHIFHATARITQTESEAVTDTRRITPAYAGFLRIGKLVSVLVSVADPSAP
jgi:conjugative relaxase-like TrwC/TraI family protein